jgi:hypothetical protein
MPTIYLSVLPEDLADAAFAEARLALERATAAGAEVTAIPGAPLSVRAEEPVLAALRLALGPLVAR